MAELYAYGVKSSVKSKNLRIFRESTYLVTLFVKTDAFTKFLSKKCEREFPEFPHCAAAHKTILWSQKLCETILFVILCKLLSRNIFPRDF